MTGTKVVKPFSVQSGTATPWFGQSGGGTICDPTPYKNINRARLYLIRFNYITHVTQMYTNGHLFPEMNGLFPEMNGSFPEMNGSFPEINDSFPEMNRVFREVQATLHGVGFGRGY